MFLSFCDCVDKKTTPTPTLSSSSSPSSVWKVLVEETSREKRSVVIRWSSYVINGPRARPINRHKYFRDADGRVHPERCVPLLARMRVRMRNYARTYVYVCACVRWPRKSERQLICTPERPTKTENNHAVIGREAVEMRSRRRSYPLEKLTTIDAIVARYHRSLSSLVVAWPSARKIARQLRGARRIIILIL